MNREHQRRAYKYKKLETTELYTNTDRHPAEYKTCMIPNIRTSILLLFLFAAAAFIHAIYISLGFLLVLCNTWWVSVCYLHILFADFCYSVGIVYVSALLCFPNGRARFFWENRFFFTVAVFMLLENRLNRSPECQCTHTQQIRSSNSDMIELCQMTEMQNWLIWSSW